MEIGEEEKALKALFQSFLYDLPRAEILVNLGYYYQKKMDYEKSIFWFKFILSLEKPTSSLGFINHNNWDYVPCIELAVCYDRIGDIEKAIHYNNEALKLKPSSSQALYNKNYFESLIIGKDME